MKRRCKVNVKISSDAIRVRLSESEFTSWLVKGESCEIFEFPADRSFKLALFITTNGREGIELGEYSLNCFVSQRRCMEYSSGKMGKNDAIEFQQELPGEKYLKIIIDVDIFKSRK